MFDTLDVDVDTVPIDRLADEITTFSAHLAAATCRWLLMVAAFDRREGFLSWECRSMAHWLSWRCGWSLGPAREHVRVARAIEMLPSIRARFATGALSYSKVRALTRVATPETDDWLAELAETMTAAQLDKVMRAYRGCTADEELDEVNARHERRRFTWWWDEDGSMVFDGRLSPEDGAIFLAALSKGRAVENVPAGTLLPAAQRDADALVQVARMALAAEEGKGDGEAREVITHVDATTITADAEGRCHLDDGPALAPETARRLACEARLIALIENGDGEPLGVSTTSRAPNRTMRRLLKARDGGCRFPGCTNKGWLDAHHVVHWVYGGPTSLPNLCLLCRRHHRAVHEGGWTIEGNGKGEFTFRDPAGRVVPHLVTAPVGDAQQLLADNDRCGLDITARTSVPSWAGERFDLPYIVDVLVNAKPGPRQPSAA